MFMDLDLLILKISFQHTVQLLVFLIMLTKKIYQLRSTGNGNQLRDFIHVKDVAEANYLAMKSKIKNEIFNVGTGKTISIKNLSFYFTKKPTFIKKRSGEANITCASIKK